MDTSISYSASVFIQYIPQSRYVCFCLDDNDDDDKNDDDDDDDDYDEACDNVDDISDIEYNNEHEDILCMMMTMKIMMIAHLWLTLAIFCF